MKIDIYGVYRLMAGEKTIEVSITPGTRLLDLLYEVVSRFPTLRGEMFDERGSLYPYIPLFINGRNPRLLEDGIDTVMKPQDVLSIFSPMSSGRLNVKDINQSLSSSFPNERL